MTYRTNWGRRRRCVYCGGDDHPAECGELEDAILEEWLEQTFGRRRSFRGLAEAVAVLVLLWTPLIAVAVGVWLLLR